MKVNHQILSQLFIIWEKLSKNQKKNVITLFGIMLLSAIAELFSLGTVVPFLSVITNPDLLARNKTVASLMQLYELNNQNLLIIFTLVFVVATFTTSSIRLYNLKMNCNVVASVGVELSIECYRRFLHQPYSIHIKTNSSKVISTMISNINRTLIALNAFAQMLTAAVVTFSLMLGLAIINWKIALVGICIFASAYYVVGVISRRRLKSNGQKMSVAMERQVKVMQEGLGAIRDIILESSHDLYISSYKTSDELIKHLQANNDLITKSPRFFLESIGLIAIAGFSCILAINKSYYNGNVIVILGAFAVGMQRLLPSMQQTYNGWAVLNGYSSDVLAVVKTLNSPFPQNKQIDLFGESCIYFDQSIVVKDLSYHYGDKNKLVINKISLSVQKGEKIGFIGKSGSGKSTLVDIMMGLLEPTSGSLKIDGVDLYHANEFNILNWRRMISHVPQQIFLADTSIAENIAFGIPRNKIDFNQVRRAALKASALDFIELLPSGFDTRIGQNGIMLSGGQRQRIGIARALYKETKLLVLDEATSALDNDTENEIIQSLNLLNKDLTVLLIAHRHNTLMHCDRIYKLINSKLECLGNPQDAFG